MMLEEGLAKYGLPSGASTVEPEKNNRNKMGSNSIDQ